MATKKYLRGDLRLAKASFLKAGRARALRKRAGLRAPSRWRAIIEVPDGTSAPAVRASFNTATRHLQPIISRPSVVISHRSRSPLTASISMYRQHSNAWITRSRIASSTSPFYTSPPARPKDSIVS